MNGRYKHQTGNANIIVMQKTKTTDPIVLPRFVITKRRLNERTARRKEMSQKRTRLKLLTRSLSVDIGTPHLHNDGASLAGIFHSASPATTV
jgi:hypothetical protein